MNIRTNAVVLVIALGSFVLAGDVPPAGPPSKSQGAFDQLKVLVGDWSDKAQNATVSYKLVSDSSVIMETFECHGGMVSMYHLDNDNLMMTHYCAVHNQPRMRAEPFKAGDKSITFSFIDGTNMPDANAGHMHKLVITFVDADHVNEDWTYWKDGKAGETASFKFERVKK